MLLNILDGIVYPRKIEKQGKVCELVKRGYKTTKFFLPDFKKDGIQHRIAMTEDYFDVDLLDELRRKYLKKGMSYLDIGANIGNHTVYFCQRCNARRVWSFEPVTRVYEILKRNVQINQLSDKVRTYQCALGAKDSKAKIKNFYEYNMGATELTESETGGIELRMLDSLGINSKIDFVKIDVEGFEYDVLKGGKKFFTENSPLIFIESFPDKYPMVKNILEGYGYMEKESFPGDNYIYVKR